jgi:hypothetical protein
MLSTLKLVILYDARNNSYSICDHNLTLDGAKRAVAERGGKLLSPFILNQRARHRNDDPQACRACRREIAHSSGLQPKPRFQRRDR